MNLGAPILDAQVVSSAPTAAQNGNFDSSTDGEQVGGVQIKNPIVVVKPNSKGSVTNLANSLSKNQTIVNVKEETKSSGNPGLLGAVLGGLLAVILVGGLIGLYIYKKYSKSISSFDVQPVNSSPKSISPEINKENMDHDIYED